MSYAKHSHQVVTTNAAKFSLYIKAREIKQIGQALEHILLLPKKDREAWIKQNGEFMNRGFNEFIDESSETFESLSFDEEMIELSQELVSSLQETFNRVQNMLSERKILKS